MIILVNTCFPYLIIFCEIDAVGSGHSKNEGQVQELEKKRIEFVLILKHAKEWTESYFHCWALLVDLFVVS